ncbi:MAG: DUF368 domain-containing protein [Marinilabiliaceae bacterium]|nr:DUF368 domain-containing protein [Marinilabiliaceae bacterium]
MQRTPLNYLLISLKGIAMGAADVVPGVSGGTIAFITGIYEELLASIKGLPTALPVLWKKDGGVKKFWEAANLNFLLSLGLGIVLSILSLARLMTWLLETHPIVTWSFFFGLILASVWYIMRELNRINIQVVVGFVAGTLLAWWITTVSPTETTNATWFVFVSGAIAICAMILPGISGSFILLLLGKYLFMMSAIKEMKVAVILVFMAGAGVGIITFSNVLTWLLKKYHAITVAVLGGFMVGSLNKVWPWKEVTSTYINSHGVTKPLTESNVLPTAYEAVSGQAALLVPAVVAALVGLGLVFAIEYVAKMMKR